MASLALDPRHAADLLLAVPRALADAVFRLTPGPTQVLTTFCDAINQQDLNTAWGQPAKLFLRNGWRSSPACLQWRPEQNEKEGLPSVAIPR